MLHLLHHDYSTIIFPSSEIIHASKSLRVLYIWGHLTKTRLGLWICSRMDQLCRYASPFGILFITDYLYSCGSKSHSLVLSSNKVGSPNPKQVYSLTMASFIQPEWLELEAGHQPNRIHIPCHHHDPSESSLPKYPSPLLVTGSDAVSSISDHSSFPEGLISSAAATWTSTWSSDLFPAEFDPRIRT